MVVFSHIVSPTRREYNVNLRYTCRHVVGAAASARCVVLSLLGVQPRRGCGWCGRYGFPHVADCASLVVNVRSHEL